MEKTENFSKINELNVKKTKKENKFEYSKYLILSLIIQLQ